MGVVIEAFTVLVRNSVLDEKYPGGQAAFFADCPNQTYCTDGSLSRVAFMHPSDVESFVTGLAAKGLVPQLEGRAVDVAIVRQDVAFLGSHCDWLVFATFRGAAVAWLNGMSPAPIVGPPGYQFGRTVQFISGDQARERLVYIRTQDGVDVFRDKETGKDFYLGRASGPPGIE